jgi:hypothetical protein
MYHLHYYAASLFCDNSAFCSRDIEQFHVFPSVPLHIHLGGLGVAQRTIVSFSEPSRLSPPLSLRSAALKLDSDDCVPLEIVVSHNRI